MTASFSLAELIGDQVAAGMQPKFSHLPTRRGYGERAGAPYYGKDVLGREYYLPVTFRWNTQITESGLFTLNQAEEYVLPHPVISIDSSKRVVETPLTERNATVKEFINIAGYRITIRGWLIGQNNELPEQQMADLIALYELNQPLEIQNVLTDLVLVRPETTDQVIITDLRFPEKRGVKHVREYEMTLINDAPFSLIDIS